MKFRVIFAPQVNRDLVDIWVESDQQREITMAVDGLVRHLESDPVHLGESRGKNRRVAFEGPIGIAFRVDEDAHEVKIYSLWIVAKHEE